MAKRIEFTKTNNKCTQKVCSLKKIIVKGRQDGEYKKRKLENMTEEAIDTLINCFQSH